MLIFKLALEQAGLSYILRHAGSCMIIFELLEERLPDVLFLDIQMPCDDGISCLAQIRQNKSYDDLPIIMLTSNMHRQVIEECFKGGADLYLLKPNTVAEFVNSLKNIFMTNWEDHRKKHSPDNFVLN